jgi:hypothetical protein
LRCAGLPCPMPTSQPLAACKEMETDYFGAYSMKPQVVASPDMNELQLSDSDLPTCLPIREKENVSPSKGRKRGRSSVDLSLHQNVREFLNPSVRSYMAQDAIRDDRLVAEPSVFLQSSPCPSGTRTPVAHQEYYAKALQSPARSIPERRLPVSKDLGRKRACCASEAASVMSFSGGPGMWGGIL